MPNLTESHYKKLKVDGSFKAYKYDDLKVTYRIKSDNENSYHERRIISKILKLEKNNQYGFARTRPIPVGCIKVRLLHHGSNSVSFSKLLIGKTRLDICLL